MKTFVVSILAMSAVTLLAISAQAQGRPSRDVDHSNSPAPIPSTPGDGGGSGSVSYPDRPSRDVDHGSYDSDCCSSGSYDSGYHSGYHGGGYSSGTISCAPGEIASNVALTDKALKTIAATPAFAKAAKFKTAIASISSNKDAAARADAYMKLAGINSRDSKQVVEFVGAREARGTWIVELQRNAELSEAQAVSVAQSLQGALRGGLN